MQGRIVERIAADHVGLPVACAGPEGDAVDVAAGLREVEDALRSDKGDVLPVRNAPVEVHAESGQRIAPFALRGAHTVEPVDDQHAALFVGHAAGRKRLARKALAALVDGRDPVGVHASRLLPDGQAGLST